MDDPRHSSLSMLGPWTSLASFQGLPTGRHTKPEEEMCFTSGAENLSLILNGMARSMPWVALWKLLGLSSLALGGCGKGGTSVQVSPCLGHKGLTEWAVGDLPHCQLSPDNIWGNGRERERERWGGGEREREDFVSRGYSYSLLTSCWLPHVQHAFPEMPE